MLVLIHVIIAILSLVISAYSFLSPSKNGIRICQILIGLTLASGTFLVIVSHANMWSACISGLVYLVVVTFGLTLSSKKLAITENKNN